jgi:hypothetical protein
VRATARKAWGYEERGENWYGRGGVVAVERDHFDRYFYADPDAYILLSALKGSHGRHEPFILANATAERLGWGRRRFYSARERLEADGVIHCVSPGGRGPNDPPLYAWVNHRRPGAMQRGMRRGEREEEGVS